MPRRIKDRASYEITETVDNTSMNVSVRLDNARNATISLIEINQNNNSNKTINKPIRKEPLLDERIYNPLTSLASIQCSQLEADLLCDWLLEKGYGHDSIIKREYEKRIGSE